ncbi:PLP-dependent aminotransferase family protein [Ideonella sp. DXS29W]|uniref:PLP-dependent aminotransferase family protein n=1 Tax=Ideonella lacteola TaxID=2984193 RepID=A0ABU9BU88_9BURK
MVPVFPFDFTLPRDTGGLAQALHRVLRDAVLDGRLPAGSPLPSTRTAAQALGLSRNTVVAAYDLLVAEGYVLPRSGARSVVAPIATRRAGSKAAGGSSVLTQAWQTERIVPLWRAPQMGPDAARTLPERNFRLGVPDHRPFPHAVWRRLTARSLREWSRSPFGYPPTEGLPALREAIAKHLGFSRAVACEARDVVVTSGAQQAFDLLARLLVTPGRTQVAVEEPGYPPLRAAFAAAGAVLVPVPVDDEGLRVDQLPDTVRVVSVTPSHQSPTGAALSLHRRAALLDWARARHAVILEDDYDGEFRFGARPLDALQTLDRDGIVFYIGTFSKCMFPSLRKGFVVSPPWARDALLAVKHCADSHCDTITQSALAAFIHEGHLARHVRRMRALYAARRQVLLEGLQRELAAWLRPIPSEAGLHMAARIVDTAHTDAIVNAMRRCLPGAQTSAEYSMASGPPWALSFGYGTVDAEAIVPALRRMRRALQVQGGS